MPLMSICIVQSCVLPWTAFGCSRTSQVHNVKELGILMLDDAASQGSNARTLSMVHMLGSCFPNHSRRNTVRVSR